MSKEKEVGFGFVLEREDLDLRVWADAEFENEEGGPVVVHITDGFGNYAKAKLYINNRDECVHLRVSRYDPDQMEYTNGETIDLNLFEIRNMNK